MQQNVYIAGDISYVSGAINGTSYVWTLTGDHVWSASNVTVADDGEYLLDLIAIDTAGNELHVTTTTYYGLHLITDRGPGAYYNASDLNRVGAAVEYLAARMHDNGYEVSVSPKLNWTVLDIPSLTQMQTYLGDVGRIKDGFHGTQDIPSGVNGWYWYDANNIEKSLLEVEILLNRMIAATVAQCGILHAGGYV